MKVRKKRKRFIKNDFLDRERNALSEERTILAYIRTELAFIGIILLALKFYFDEFSWSINLAIILIVILGVILIFESVKIKKLRKKRHELQEKYVHLK